MQFIYCSLLLLVLCTTALGVDLNVHTIYGNITGNITPSGLYKIWNTRYAQSPAGMNRWRSPIPLVPWSGTIDASQNPPICPQEGGLSAVANVSEDCLYLSVYVPINHTLSDPLLPVQVFVHGGTFLTGGAIFYTGEVLAGKDLIYISINYRLGALGFLAHPALYTPENGAGVGIYGIQDQRAALQWVQDNIQFFGGDKSKVTLSGESAGAISTCIHFALPKSKGLFSQGIMESGFCNGLMSNASALAFGQTIVDGVQCGTSPNVLSCLLAANATQLNAVSYGVSPALTSELTAQPIDMIKSGKANQVPLLIGTNYDEYSIFVCPSYANITAAQYAQIVEATLPQYATEALTLYPASAYSTPVQAYIAVGSDYTFKCPSRDLADYFSLSQNSPVFMYSFNNQPSFFLIPAVTQVLVGSSDVQCLGACHAFEIPYLFNLYEAFTMLYLNSTELVLRGWMRNAWASFVTSGVPSLPSFAWPHYNSTTASYVNLDISGLTVGSQFRSSYCAFWNSDSNSSTTSSSSTTTSTASSPSTTSPSTSSTTATSTAPSSTSATSNTPPATSTSTSTPSTISPTTSSTSTSGSEKVAPVLLVLLFSAICLFII